MKIFENMFFLTHDLFITQDESNKMKKELTSQSIRLDKSIDEGEEYNKKELLAESNAMPATVGAMPATVEAMPATGGKHKKNTRRKTKNTRRKTKNTRRR
jgi:ribosomal protein L12E/L44/L45/RPP1/RPP2